MSPLAGPLASILSLQIPNGDGGSGRPLPMKDLRPLGRRSAPARGSLAPELSERDRQVLALVARFRIMSGAQLCELFWPEGTPETRARLARRGLARLATLEVLSPLARRVGGVRGGSSGTVYAVGRTGQRLLAAASPGKRVRRPYTPGQRHLNHTICVGDLYVELVRAERWGLAELLAFDPEPLCWRQFTTGYGARETLKPDAYTRLGIGKYEHCWFIECDLATEAPVTIAGKALRYLECYRSGELQDQDGVFPRTAWIVPDATRAKVIEQALSRLPAEARKLFSVAPVAEALAALTGGAS